MLGTIYHVRNRINPHGSFHGASLVSLACTIKLKEEEGEDETKQSRYPAGRLSRPVIWFSAWYTHNNTIAGASLLWSGPFFNGPHYSPLSEANGSCLIWLHQ